MRPFLLLAASVPFASTAFAQNDECTSATTVTAGTFMFDTSTATQSPEFWPCAGSGGPDLWYTFTAPNSATVTISTCGSTYDTALEAFDGTCASLVSLVCNDDSCGLQSSVSFAANAGSTYFFRIGGWNGSTGSGTCTVNDGSPVLNPANGHYYAVVSAPGISWDQARLDAAATSFMGATGHLVTSTDATEQAFIAGSLGNVQWHWMGGFQNTQSPNYSEPGGGWEWITG